MVKKYSSGFATVPRQPHRQDFYRDNKILTIILTFLTTIFESERWNATVTVLNFSCKKKVKL